MRKRIAGLVLLLALYVALVSCDDSNVRDSAEVWDSWTEEWVIGSEVLISSEEIRFYWVKKGDNPVWQLVKGDISYLNFEEGHEYVALIKASKASESAPLEYSTASV